MAGNTEALKSMLQDIINDKPEQASVALHDYFVSKTREVAGLDAVQTESDDIDEVVDVEDENE